MHVNHRHIRINLRLSYLANMLSILFLVSVVNARVSVKYPAPLLMQPEPPYLAQP